MELEDLLMEQEYETDDGYDSEEDAMLDELLTAYENIIHSTKSDKSWRKTVTNMSANMTAIHTPEYTSDEDFEPYDDEDDDMLDQLLEAYQDRVQKIQTEMQQLRLKMDVLEMEKISFKGRETELLRIIDGLSK